MKKEMRVKCVARIPTQAIRDDGMIVTYAAGESDYFLLEDGQAPTNFVVASQITKDNVNFRTVSAAFLAEDTIPLEDLVEFMRAEFGEDCIGEPRREVVRRLLHCRAIQTQLPSQLGNIPAAHEFKNKNVELDSVGFKFDEATKTPVVEEELDVTLQAIDEVTTPVVDPLASLTDASASKEDDNKDDLESLLRG